MNLHEILRKYGYGYLQYSEVICYRRDQSRQFLWQYVLIFCQPSYIYIAMNSKTIQSIFIKFSGQIDIVLSCTENYMVTIDINLYGFYGKIIAIFIQVYYT